jgi:hypothetical protein
MTIRRLRILCSGFGVEHALIGRAGRKGNRTGTARRRLAPARSSGSSAGPSRNDIERKLLRKRRSSLSWHCCSRFYRWDEAVAIHERITKFTIRHAWVSRFRGDHGAWIFLYGVLGALVVALMRRDLAAFWYRYPTPARAMLAGFALTVAGGVGLEIG